MRPPETAAAADTFPNPHKTAKAIVAMALGPPIRCHNRFKRWRKPTRGKYDRREVFFSSSSARLDRICFSGARILSGVKKLDFQTVFCCHFDWIAGTDLLSIRKASE
jgi:hypothetical protein